jgi:hypothetical protein
MEITEPRTVYGIKSELTPDGIVWHLTEGWKDNASSFATWTRRIATYGDYLQCRCDLLKLEGRA